MLLRLARRTAIEKVSPFNFTQWPSLWHVFSTHCAIGAQVFHVCPWYSKGNWQGEPSRAMPPVLVQSWGWTVSQSGYPPYAPAHPKQSLPMLCVKLVPSPPLWPATPSTCMSFQPPLPPCLGRKSSSTASSPSAMQFSSPTCQLSTSTPHSLGSPGAQFKKFVALLSVQRN